MIKRLYQNQQNIIQFYFYNEDGQAIQVLNPVANLYSTLDGSIVDSNLSLLEKTDVTIYWYDLIYTPTINEGSYYFIATGTDNDGILRTNTVFVDVVNVSKVELAFDIQEVAKFIDDLNIDYSILPLLIKTAVEWINDYTGYVLLPCKYNESYLVEEEIFLKFYPVISINVFTVNGVDVSDKIVYKDFETGKLVLDRTFVSSNVNNYINIEYISGLKKIPDTVFTAVGMFVSYLYSEHKYQNYQRIKSLGLTTTFDKEVINRIKQLLNPFKKIS